MHLYHCLAFDLDANAIFHHLILAPLIGGIHFAYPWGCAFNLLNFFISGLPSGIDYALLAAVKAGRVTSFFEKRVNCSLNTWLRAPGLTMFCVVATACWLHPYPGTPPEDLMPTWLFLPTALSVFYNGQYYAQRVIGNYYIRKAQEHGRRRL